MSQVDTIPHFYLFLPAYGSHLFVRLLPICRFLSPVGVLMRPVLSASRHQNESTETMSGRWQTCLVEAS